MNKANQFYWQAKGYRKRLQELAVEFYNECIENFEKNYAKEGCFSVMLDLDKVPDTLRYDFEDFVIPLFEAEGFKVEKHSLPSYGFGCEHDGWEISWDLKEEEIKDD